MQGGRLGFKMFSSSKKLEVQEEHTETQTRWFMVRAQSRIGSSASRRCSLIFNRDCKPSAMSKVLALRLYYEILVASYENQVEAGGNSISY